MRAGRREVRLVGQGGQGLALAGLILADAAVRDGKNVVMTHSYGAQQRGGPSQADVIVSDEEIDYPKVVEADVLVIFSEEAYERYHHRLPKDGLVMVDTSEMQRSRGDGARLVPVPFTTISKEVTDSDLSANMVALGVMAELTKLVSRRSLLRALRRMSPRASLESNRAAVKRGVKEAETVKGKYGL